jgi:hypothetical protein
MANWENGAEYFQIPVPRFQVPGSRFQIPHPTLPCKFISLQKKKQYLRNLAVYTIRVETAIIQGTEGV